MNDPALSLPRMRRWGEAALHFHRWVGLVGLFAFITSIFACDGPPDVPTFSIQRSGLTVDCPPGLTAVHVQNTQGMPLIHQRAPAPVPQMQLTFEWPGPGAYFLDAQCGGLDHRIPLTVPDDLPAFEVEIEAPLGQGAHSLGAHGLAAQGAGDGKGDDVVFYQSFEGAKIQGAALILAHMAGPYSITQGDQPPQTRHLAPGQRWAHAFLLDGPVDLLIRGPQGERRVLLRPDKRSNAALGSQIHLKNKIFPANGAGGRDLARDQGRITLPSPWWKGVLDGLGLGVRARDRWAPWAHLGLQLQNDGDAALNLAVQLRLVDAENRPIEALLPLMRDKANGEGAVQRLMRLPAQSTGVAVLPVYVRQDLLPPDLLVVYGEVIISPLGAATPIHVSRFPIYISRGSGIASAGLLVAVLAALLGFALLALRLRRWLGETPTSDLMTIALFGSMTFVVGAFGRLIGMGVAAALGPFSTLLTALVDDLFRYALLATLITLLPRVGTATLATLVGWLLSGLALGTFGPSDLLFVGGRVFWLEGALWVFGITRHRRWLDGPRAGRFFRLAGAFSISSLCGSATGLILNVVLYRLFLAPWYVAMILIFPAFLYVVLACAIAIPFADSLRRVQR